MKLGIRAECTDNAKLAHAGADVEHGSRICSKDFRRFSRHIDRRPKTRRNATHRLGKKLIEDTVRNGLAPTHCVQCATQRFVPLWSVLVHGHLRCVA